MTVAASGYYFDNLCPDGFKCEEGKWPKKVRGVGWLEQRTGGAKDRRCKRREERSKASKLPSTMTNKLILVASRSAPLASCAARALQSTALSL